MSISENRLFPLTKNQQSIWLEAIRYPTLPLGNIGYYFEFSELPDVDLLCRAIEKTVAQNDGLRIRFLKTDRGLAQEVSEKSSVRLEKINLPAATRETAFAYLQERFLIPIQLDDSELLKFEWIPFNKDRAFLFVRCHHILLDGWGRSLLVREIAAHYKALKENQTHTKHSTIAELINEANTQSAATFHREFWRDNLLDLPRSSVLERKYSPDLIQQGVRERMIFKREQLTAFAKNKAPFYACLAALFIQLSRSTGKNDFCIGIPVLNRPTDAAKNTLGYAVGLIPLRLRYDASSTFEAFVQHIHSAFEATIPHRNCAIEEINAAIGTVARDMPLFDVVFSYADHSYNVEFEGAIVSDFGTLYHGVAQHPLVIHLQSSPNPDLVHFEFEFGSAHFNATDRSSFIRRFNKILQFLAQHKLPSIASIPFFDSDEIETLKTLGTGKKRDLPEATIVDQILEMAAKFPERIIVSDENRDFTYQQLVDGSERLAGVLQAKGLTKGQAVAVHIGRTVDYFVAVLAVLRTGCFFIPFDPTLSENRKKDLLEQATVSWLIDSVEFQFQPTQWNGTTTRIDTQTKHNFQSVETTQESIAYAIFTSGTTGKPKAVTISHRSLLNILTFFHDEVLCKYPDQAPLALISSLQFDASILHLLGSMLFGNPVKIVPENMRRDGRLLVNFLAEHRIVVCDGLPALIQPMFVRTPEKPSNYCVAHYYLGGEPMTLSFVNQLFAWHQQDAVQVTNAYGPTETTVNSTYFTFDRVQAQNLREMPIGQPVFNTQVRILDSDGKLLPIGAKGEICIGGIGLSTGYLNAPELSASKFVWNQTLNEKLYHTGDFGRMNADGLLTCYGRMDHQLKIRGYRIEPGEIEYWINRIPKIEQSVVLVHEVKHSQSLVAVLQSSFDWSLTALREHLQAHLPSYMLPSFVVTEKQFPLTPTGKIDRVKLQEKLVHLNPKSKQLPETATEEKLAKMIQNLLQIDEVDVLDSFFSQGGDSLGLVFFLSEIEKEWQLAFSVNTFASMSSIREMAAFLDSAEAPKESPLFLEQLLPETNVSGAPLSTDNPPSKSAFLTGATGFVGIYLLRELLLDFDTVYCLIRAENELAALEKLKNSTKNYEVGIDFPRVQIVLGNLSSPNCGMSPKDVTTVSTLCEAIFHCGADVNFLKDYASLENVNVRSTEFLLSLCATIRTKHFHFISTVSIFTDQEGIFSEEDSSASQRHYSSKGYRASKWVAEACVERARKTGLSCTIYRLGRITASQQKGGANRSDFFHRILDGCLNLGKIPQESLEHRFDLTPVDLAAKAICCLSNHKEGRNFHIINPKSSSLAAFVSVLNTHGTSLQLVTYKDWLEAIIPSNGRGEMHPLFLILPILKQKTWISVKRSTIICVETTQLLESHCIDWPNADLLWEKYVSDSPEYGDFKRINTNR